MEFPTPTTPTLIEIPSKYIGGLSNQDPTHASMNRDAMQSIQSKNQQREKSRRLLDALNKNRLTTTVSPTNTEPDPVVEDNYVSEERYWVIVDFLLKNRL